MLGTFFAYEESHPLSGWISHFSFHFLDAASHMARAMCSSWECLPDISNFGRKTSSTIPGLRTKHMDRY
eukprot:m.51133 g.51133  ORF g.51133 m.51133 type:complete len:69 (+) comp18118_c0_seq1:664-870(+)